MSSLRRLDSVAHHDHVLCLRPCQRCCEPFESCHSCQPGRLYCDPCAPLAQRERRRRAHRTYYRSPEGRRQHHDEEHDRRKRRRRERNSVGGRDRRPVERPASIWVAPSIGEPAAEPPDVFVALAKPRSGPAAPHTIGRWTLVAWPGLYAEARRRLGTVVSCPLCGRSGLVAEVLSLRQWRRRSKGA